jgi:long-chain fatty acid transport protein
MRGLGALSVLFFSALSTTALASGYGLREHSVDALGMAYAGTAASSDDASYLAYNPASLAGVVDSDATVNLVAIFPTSDASYATALTAAGSPTGGLNHPTDFVDNAYVPSAAFRTRINDRWAVGLSISAPWGLSTDYPESWAGRYYALKTQLFTLNATPIVSYQVSPRLALAAGLQVEYAWGTLSSAIDFGTLGALFGMGTTPGASDGRGTFEASDWGVGFLLGAQMQLSDTTTLGISYRSSISHTLEGPLRFGLDADGIGAIINGATGLFANTHAETKLDTPDVVNAGLRVQFSDRWTGLIGADWTNWSRFKSLDVNAVNPAQPTEITTAHWEDSWFVSLGAEYAANESWTFRAGAAYDDSPVPDSTREPRIPDHGRFWLAAGATWHASETLDVKFAYAHMFLEDSRIALSTADPANALRGTLAGKVSLSGEVVGVALSWRT